MLAQFFSCTYRLGIYGHKLCWNYMGALCQELKLISSQYTLIKQSAYSKSLGILCMNYSNRTVA